MEAPFSEKEIKNAIWSLGMDKAPVLDVFPIPFLKNFWTEMKTDIKMVMREL